MFFLEDINDILLDSDNEYETTTSKNTDDIPDSWMDEIDDLSSPENVVSFPIKKHVVFSKVSLLVKNDGSKVLREVIINQLRWLACENMPEGWKFAREFDVCTPLDEILAVCSSSKPKVYHTARISPPPLRRREDTLSLYEEAESDVEYDNDSFYNDSPRKCSKGRKHSKRKKIVVPDN